MIGNIGRNCQAPQPAGYGDTYVNHITSNTTTVGAIVHKTGAHGLAFGMGVGVHPDGDYEFKLYGAPVGDSDMSEEELLVEGTDYIGTCPNYTGAEAEEMVWVDVISEHEYFRAKIVSTNHSSGAYLYLLSMLYDFRQLPQA